MSTGTTARDCANSVSRASCGDADPDHHARPAEHLGLGVAGAASAPAPPARRRRPGSGRRLPRRRRELERHRVFDRAILELAHARSTIAAARATAARRPSPPSRPFFTSASSIGFSFSARCSWSVNFLRRASPSAFASRRAPSSSKPVTDRRSTRTSEHLLRHGALQPLELRRHAGRQLSGEPDIAARRSRAARAAASRKLPTAAPTARTGRRTAARTDRTRLCRRRAAGDRTARARRAAKASCRGRSARPARAARAPAPRARSRSAAPHPRAPHRGPGSPARPRNSTGRVPTSR